MNSSRQIVIYSILRLLLFAVPFTIFMLMSIEWWASALLATGIAVSLSYLLLVKQRHQVAATVESWRHGTNKAGAGTQGARHELSAVPLPGVWPRGARLLRV